jgi:hypothetical protein
VEKREKKKKKKKKSTRKDAIANGKKVVVNTDASKMIRKIRIQVRITIAPAPSYATENILNRSCNEER